MKIGLLLNVLALAGILFSGWNYFQILREEKNQPKKKSKDGKGEKASARDKWLSFGRSGFYFMTLMVVLGSVYLMYLILSHQFQVSYVYRYTSTDLPLGYLISAFWAGQEGSFLLWTLLTAIMGVVFIRRAREYEANAMLFLNVIQAFFLILLFKASPFALSAQTPLEGAGLNPLLQNFWMVIHPPILFVGYAAAAFPLIIAWAGLRKKLFSQWSTKAFPWVLFTAITLGAGIIIGGFWAYEVLGWGGYWGWDPVENSSLIPWLTTLALLHGLIVQKISGALKKTNMFLAFLSFVLVLYATYLTRSGVLSDFSVHSFTDYGLNVYMVLFMLTVVVLGFGAFASRFKEIQKTAIDFSTPNRENALFASIWVFGVIAFFIFIGTSSPIFTGLVGDPSQVHTSFYNKMNLPFGILLALLLGITPFLQWHANNFSELLKKLFPSFLSALVVWGVALFLGLSSFLKLLFLFGATFALVSNAIVVLRNLRINWQLIGAPLSHVGVGIMLIGIIISGNFASDDRVVLDKGIPTRIMNYELTYQGRVPADNAKDILNIRVVTGDENYTATPRFYYSEYNRSMMREPDVQSGLFYDLYLSPLEVRQASQGVGSSTSPANNHQALILKKGETKEIENLKVQFQDFEMKNHAEGGAVKVGARLDVSNGEDEVEVIPVIHFDQNGKHAEPVLIPLDNSNEQVTVSIAQLNASEGAVELHFDGLASEATSASLQQNEQLILEISKKPFMNILWIGTILIIIGALIPLSRRVEESAK